MIENMYFVYSLTYNGQVFYIGKTKDLIKRYSMHINLAASDKCTNSTSQYIKTILQSGYFPEVNIIAYEYNLEAVKLEALLISSFTKAGHPLTNMQYSWKNWAKMHNPSYIPKQRTKKVMLKIIRYKQESYIHQYACRLKNYSFRFPNEPFTEDETGIS